MAGRLNLASHSFNLKDSLSAFEETNLAILSHPNLAENAHFKELKSYLSKYYEDRSKPPDQQTMHTGQDRRWKDRLYCSLQTLMSELTYTQDAECQEELLEKVYHWFRGKIGRQLPQIVHRSPAVAPPKLSVERPLTAKPLTVKTAPKPYIPSDECYETEQDKTPALDPRSQLLKQWRRSKSKEFAQRTQKNSSARKQHFSQYSLVSDEAIDFRLEQSDTLDDSKGIFKDTQSNLLHRLDFRKELSAKKLRPNTASLYSQIEIDKFLNRRFVDEATNVSFNTTLNGQMNEVMVIKGKLASLKIPYKLKDLESAIVMPDMPLLKQLAPFQLPRGGERLLSNPALKDKKKKKKGKGKKKKGKKKK